MSAVHRVRVPRRSQALVAVGQAVEPDDVIAMDRPPAAPIAVQVAGRLRRSPEDAARLLVARPGATLDTGDVIARDGEREVGAPTAGLLLTYDASDGSAILAPLGAPRPVVAHVRGEVLSVAETVVEIGVRGAVLDGVGGTGEAVHGELTVAVHEPGEELRAGAIDVGAAGKIVVGGSRASAETLIRARAMGVAGIVLGGILDKELRDFEAIQRRRREMGGMTGSFGLVLLEGFGKVGMDPQLFGWFVAHHGRVASLIGGESRLYVYDAMPPPLRSPLVGTGDRVVAHRRPFAGRGGVVVRIVDELHAAASGVRARSALVRFEDGRMALVPLANLEAVRPSPTR